MKAKLFLLMFLLLPVTSSADVVTLECPVAGYEWYPEIKYVLGYPKWERLTFDIDAKEKTVQIIDRSRAREIISRQDYFNSREIFVLDVEPPKLLYGAGQPHYAYESVGFLFDRSDMSLTVNYYRQVDGAKDVSVCKRYPKQCTKNDTLISYYDKSTGYKRCKKLKAQF